MIRIVIPVHNGVDYTKGCLESLFRSTELPLEVIVVDNASTDKTQEYLQSLGDRVKVIRNEKNEGFAGAVNQGLKFVPQDFSYVLVLNNDTIVPKLLLDRMIATINMGSDFGIMGCTSNFAGGSQGLNAEYKLEELDQFADKLFLESRAVLQVGTVVGLCMLIRKKVLDDIGYFDSETFKVGNYEDSDFCLRARNAGWKCMVDNGSFIHHFGSKTFQSKGPQFGRLNFLLNRRKFNAKWNSIYKVGQKKRIIGAMRVLNGEPYIERALDAAEKFCDEIVVLVGADSTDNTWNICKKREKVVLLEKGKPGYNESRDRNQILDMLRSRKPEWVFLFDHDEVPEDKLARKIQVLCNYPDPNIDGWIFRVCHLWKSKDDKNEGEVDTIRTDGLWGHFEQCRLYRFREKDRIDDCGIHCFTPDTRITTIGNFIDYKEIKDVSVGDNVLTHTGQVKKVERVFKRKFEGKLLNIKACGINLKVTPNHKLYVLRPKRCKDVHNRLVCFSESSNTNNICTKCTLGNNKYTFEWVEARKLKKYDYLVLPNVRKKKTTVLSTDEAYLYGFYLGDGCLNYSSGLKSPRITLSLNIKDIDGQQKVFTACESLGLTNINFYPKDSICRIILNTGNNRIRKEFVELFKNSGKGKNKKIDSRILHLDDSIKLAVLRGLLDSDGHKLKNGQAGFRSCSYNLAYGFSLLCSSLNIPTSLTSFTGTAQFKGDLNKYTCLQYAVFISKKALSMLNNCRVGSYSNNKVREYMGRLISPILEIDSLEYSDHVYNLQVEDDESYIAEGAVVHNCGSHPFIAPENLAYSYLRIKHYGNMDPQGREHKYKRYTEVDTVKDVSCILGGFHDYYKKLYGKDKLEDADMYKHVVDETGIVLEPWIEDNTVSLCMMSGNEKQWFSKFLNNTALKLLLDEIVVVDNFSTDGTKEFLLQHGARVIDGDRAWVDEKTGRLKDYSAARNLSLSEAKSRWVLRLDPDENIPPEYVRYLFEMMQDQSVDAYLFPIKNILNVETDEWILSETCRLFKNNPNLYYDGIIHEEIHDSLEFIHNNIKPTVIKKAPFNLLHFGYLRDKKEREQKYDWYAELCQRQLFKYPNDSRLLFSLAVHYFYIGEKGKALSYYLKAIKANPNWYMPYNDIGFLWMQRGNMEKAKKYLQKAVELVRNDASVHKVYKEKIYKNYQNCIEYRKIIQENFSL